MPATVARGDEAGAIERVRDLDARPGERDEVQVGRGDRGELRGERTIEPFEDARGGPCGRREVASTTASAES